MNDDDVRLLGIDADRTIVAVNELLDFVVGLFVNVHGISQAECYEWCVRVEILQNVWGVAGQRLVMCRAFWTLRMRLRNRDQGP